MARLSRAAGLTNLARLALERLLQANGDHLLALRTLRDLLSEIGDAAACREVETHALAMLLLLLLLLFFPLQFSMVLFLSLMLPF